MRMIIDEFLQNEKDESVFLKKLSTRYSLRDFVMVDNNIKEILGGKEIDGCDSVNGSLFDYRAKRLCLDDDSVERRLSYQYLDFIWCLLELKEDVNIVLYILTYHYLAMIKQIAFQLIIMDRAPFSFNGDKISPLGKENYELYKEFHYGKFGDLTPYIPEECLEKYNDIFYKYRCDHHAIKHYSLLEYMLQHEEICGCGFELGSEFVRLLNSFVAQYKAIFSTEKIWAYMFASVEEKIISSLIDV